MLDKKLFKTEIDKIKKRLEERGYLLDIEKYQSLEKIRKDNQQEFELLLSKRNILSKEIGKMTFNKEEGVEIKKKEVSRLAEIIKQHKKTLDKVQMDLHKIYAETPNLHHCSVPVGKSEEDNVEVRKWGVPRKFDFKPQDHVEIGERMNKMDYKKAAKMSRSRFVFLNSGLARLHRALAQYMLDVHISEHGYTEVNVPLLVNEEALYGTGQLPRFLDDLFATTENQSLFLIPTAEVPLTNLGADYIFKEQELPLRFVSHTACFRREPGSYGRDTRGMIRLHQFEKVEMVQIVKPNDSYQALESMTVHAQTILERLNIPYRTVVLCSGDIGFAAAKTYDIEAWIPSQDKYREISSCSNTECFQARRMQSRWRNPNTGEIEMVHTLNGSGVAVGRAFVAVLENYQNEDGSVNVPEVLHPYMGGQYVIR